MKAPSRLSLFLPRALCGALGALALRAMAASPEPAKAPAPQPEPLTYEKLVAFFQPPPTAPRVPAPEDTKARVALGRMLFFDTRLSKNHDVSCNTCHDLATYGADHRPLSLGHKGRKGRRNSPTVYNVGGHIAQFWDGRAPTLEVQAEGPLFDENEMAMPDDRRVVATVSSMPEYVKRFQQAFPEEKKPVTLANATQGTGRLPAPAHHALALRSVPRRPAGGAHRAGAPGAGALRHLRLRHLSRRARGGRHLLPEAGARGAVPEDRGSRPVRGDAGRGGPDEVPRPHAAQRGEDGALPPRRLRGAAGRGRAASWPATSSARR